MLRRRVSVFLVLFLEDQRLTWTCCCFDAGVTGARCTSSGLLANGALIPFGPGNDLRGSHGGTSAAILSGKGDSSRLWWLWDYWLPMVARATFATWPCIIVHFFNLSAFVSRFFYALLHIEVRHHRLRGLKYKVPIPPDLPSVICSVLTLPKYGNCRALCRPKPSANEVGNSEIQKPPWPWEAWMVQTSIGNTHWISPIHSRHADTQTLEISFLALQVSKQQPSGRVDASVLGRRFAFQRFCPLTGAPGAKKKHDSLRL